MNLLVELDKTIGLLNKIRDDKDLHLTLDNAAECIVKALKAGNKILLAGNGGSAADAQHIAGEFVSKFAFERPGLAAIALTTDTSILTAIGNDYGFEKIFERQIQAIGSEGDVLIAYSTSGESKNIISGVVQAKKMGIITLGLTGARDCKLDSICDFIVKIPSINTPKIQECHAIIGHSLCGQVEDLLFGNQNA